MGNAGELETLTVENPMASDPNVTWVLDKGFVRLVDFMGGDQAVVQSARVSYGGGSKGDERDRKLLNFLMKNHHETPFEHAVFKFHIKCPIFVARQWFRHRMASYNEISGRYTEFPEEFYIPEKLRAQDTKNKQGSVAVPLSDENKLKDLFKEAHEKTFKIYHELIKGGVARELARNVLPVSTYTQFYWTVNSRSLMNFLKLRTGDGAQWEIRQFGEALLVMFEKKMPWTASAFREFILATFSH
nr:Thymidylate synthase complementing protein [uncultured bacterium]